MTDIIKQILIIITLSVLLGFSRYALLDEKFPLIKEKRILNTITSSGDSSQSDCKIPETLSEPVLINLVYSKCLFDDGSALFIDSRETDEYSISHISNAVNIPYDYYEDYEFQLDEIDFEKPLVVYCSGGECSLSIDLADYIFFDLGYFNVLVFEGGMPEWESAGYPIQ
jgi:rhodanese-related sulfurtransferase